MSKRSNRGKAYFYAMGQRDALAGKGNLFSDKFRARRARLNVCSFHAWLSGYNGH